MEHTADEMRRLKACINDLISMLALPAIWSGNEPSQIGSTLLDALVGMLRLDFAYLRLGDSFGGGTPIEMVQVAQRRNLTPQPEEVGRTLNPWLAGGPSTSRLLVPNPVGEGNVSIALRRLGLQDQMGVLVAGSARADFPTQTERLLLDVAANQAVIGLQEARRSVEQRRVAQELDHRVAQSTRELVGRKARIRRLVEANIIGIFIWNLEGGILEANEAFLHMMQYNRDDLVSGRVRWTDLTPAQWRDRDTQALEELETTGTVQPFEKEYLRKDGTRVPVLIGIASFEGSENEGVAFVLDLSEQKRAEEGLRDQANLLNLTHDAILVRDMNRVTKYWNRGAEGLYGWAAEEAVGRVVYDLLKTVFPVSLEQIEGEVIRAGRWEGELVQTRKDGTQIVVASRWSLQRDEQGAPVAILVTNNDVTGRKRAEQARQELEEQWRAAFESNPTMYFIVDAAGKIVSVNAFGAEQMGYSVSELAGQPVLNVFCEPDRDAVQRHASECFEEPGRTMRWEARKIRKDGAMLWVRETANAVFLKKQPVLLVVCENITEQKRAEEAARRSEKELRDVIETIPALVWSTSPDGAVDFVNQHWQEFTGLPAEDALGWNWETVVHPDDRTTFVADWRAALRSGRSMESEIRLRRTDGEYRWFFIRNVPLREERGNIVKWYGTGIDIDGRRRAEEALYLAISERARLAGFREEIGMALARGENLREILRNCAETMVRHLDAAFARIWTVSSNGRELELRASAGMYTRLDGSHSRIPVGQLKIGLIARERKPLLTNDVQNDPRISEKDWARRERIIAFAGYPLVVEDRVVGVMGMFSQKPLTERTTETLSIVADGIAQVIERKRAEEALRGSEAYLAEAQRLAKTGSWASSPATGDIRYWSEECYRVLGFDPGGPPPRFETFFQRIHPDDQAGSRERFEKAICERADFEMDYRIVHPGGETRNIHVVGHPNLGPSGDLVEFVGTVIDVTERKRAEEERERLRQLEADLTHMNRVSMMGELAASLAHEIKQPIAAAITNANTCLRWLARTEPDLEEARAAASRIVKDATRAAEIINRTRSLYKKGAPQREWVDVNEVIREMIVLLHDETTRHSISVRPELAESIPEVVADRIQLQQVFMNLLLNAIEAMKDTGGELTIKSQLDAEGQLLISVSDTGVGLPAEKQDQIFDAFFTTKPQGTGMGLAITRSIVESHGGRLWAAANGGRGATFYFTLPREVGAAA